MKFKYFSIVASICFFAVTSKAKTIYVDDNASAGGDGTSWVSAYKYLQDALASAEYGDEIWVAEGTYKPDQGAGKTAGDRASPFVLVNGVGMYGGFLGTENSRDPQGDNNQTILSGEINEDSELWTLNVVSGANLDQNTTLDGFRITKGNANGASGTVYQNGGGVYLKDSSLTCSNLVITNNSAKEGGGIYSNRSLNLTNCVLTNNSASRGGGIYISRTLTLTNCVLTNNSAEWGGGIYISRESSSLILNCEFSNNSASRDGGVIYSSPDASLKLTNCQLSNNSAGLEGGGIYASSHSSLILTNCILSNNSAAGDGGGIFFGGSDYSTLTSTLTNCLFKNNSAKEGGGIYSNRSLNLTNCVLTNNSASRGGGIYISRTLTLTNCVLTNNSAGSGGGIYAISSYSTSNSVFTKNYARLHGSGIYSNLSPTEESPPSIINCIFWKNKTGLSFVHGVQAARTFTHWKSIILQDEVQEKYPGDPNARDTVYEPNLNILQGWDGDARAFDADPLFVNIDNPIGPDGIWFTDDDGLRVVDGSPAIGAGHNDSLPSDVSDLDSDENTTEPIPYDALGKARRIGAKVDIGAYEFDAANPPPVVKLALSLIAESGGSVNGGGYFEEGVDANISATASIGYIFSNWSGDASGSLNPLTITVDSAKNITANFTQDLNDTDGDDLTNYAELVTHGTKVDDNDTDNDGLLDNEEIQIGTDPNISNSNIVNFLNSKASSDQDNARNAGQTEGIDMVKANPSEYNLVAKSSYDQALQDANASAEQAIADAKASAMEEGIELVKADPSNYGLYSSADLDATLLYALSDANATADQSIADAKVLAKAEGIEEGKALGENSVTSNPSAYNLVFKSSYEQALLDANASAEQAIADAKDSAKEEGVDLVKANPKTFGLYSSTDLNASIESALSEARPATAEAIANAKAEGIEEGKALGKSEGESSVTSNPSAYNLVTQDAYDQMIGELISSSETNATHYTEGWFYNPSRGWMWTNREAYPYFYDATDKDWIYFQSGNDKPKFYRYKTKTWLTVE